MGATLEFTRVKAQSFTGAIRLLNEQIHIAVTLILATIMKIRVGSLSPLMISVIG